MYEGISFSTITKDYFEKYMCFSYQQCKWAWYIVDCNHDNSGKNHTKQLPNMLQSLKIAKKLWKEDVHLLWFMVESYIYDGKQNGEKDITHGCSLTDPCIGKDKTKEFIMSLYKQL